MVSTPTLKLKPNAKPRVLSGHPWVFANEVEALLPAEHDGEVVECRDRADRFLGSGIYNSRSQIVWRRFSRERAALNGAHTLVVDFAGFPTMRAFGQPLVFDVTHSVQRPGATGTSTGGDRTKVPYLARAGVACGVDGLFLEVHEEPTRAKSDAQNALRLDLLEPLLQRLLAIDQIVKAPAAGASSARD